jgi:hypothetical protein
VWGAIAAGKPLSEIKRTPEFITAPGEMQNKVVEFYETEAAQAESLAAAREGREAARESRAAARENRAYTAELRKERELEMTGWSAYWDASRPEALRNLSHGDIVAKLPTLGRTHVERLLNDKERLTKDDATFRAAVIDDDVFKEVANSSGLTYVYTTPTKQTPEQKANLGKLRALVEDEIGRTQSDSKVRRQLSREESRAVMQSIVDTKVLLKGKDNGWFYDSDVSSIAAIVNPKDREIAYVPFDQIKDPKVIEDAVRYLQGEPGVAGLPVMEIRTRYRQRIEHAYALLLLGASRAEREAALRGE